MKFFSEKKWKGCLAAAVAVATLAGLAPAVVAAGNIALGMPTYCSSIYSDSCVSVNVNDGRLGNYWASGSIQQTGPKGGYEYVAIDLQRQFSINRIVARSRRDMDRTIDRTGWLLQVSNDPEWIEGVITVGQKQEAGEYLSDLDVSVELDGGYRYVRLASSNSAVVSELEVYGTVYIEPEHSLTSYADVEGTVLGGRVSLFQYFGVIDYPQGDFSPRTTVTRSEAASLLCRLVQMEGGFGAKQQFDDVDATHQNAGAITLLRDIDALAAAKEFRPDDLVQRVEFLKMLEILMGYETAIENRGGYPLGVYAVARELGLGVEGAEYLDRGSMIDILYEALDAPLLITFAFRGPDGSMIVQSSPHSTLLAAYYDAEINRGVVTRNSVTSLLEPGSTGKVTVGGSDYYDEWGDIDRYIGRSVYYVTDLSDPDTLRFYFEDVRRTQTLTLRAQNIVSVEEGSISYTEDDGSRTSRAETTSDLRVIMNGTAYNGWRESDFKAYEAETTLIDADNDGQFETAILKKPQILVNRFAADNGESIRVIGKNGVQIDIEEPEKCLVYKNGKLTTFDAAEENNLIYAYVSDDGSYAEFQMSSNTVVGLVTEFSDDDLVVDGNRYAFSEYMKSLNLETRIGITSTVVLNGYGEVVYLCEGTGLAADTRLLGYVAAVSANDGGLSPLRFKIFVKDGVIKKQEYHDGNRVFDIDVVDSGFVTYGCASKIRYNRTNATAGDLERIAAADPSTLTNKMAYFRANDKGEITQIDYESANEGAELQRLPLQLNSAQDVFIVNLNGIFRYNAMIQPLQSDSPVFVIPTVSGQPVSGGEYDARYAVRTAREIYGNYALITSNPTFYQPDEYGYAAFSVSYREEKELGSEIVSPINMNNTNTMLVQKVVRRVNASGEEYYAVNGLDVTTGTETEAEFSSMSTKLFNSYRIALDHPAWFNTYGWLQSSYVSDADKATYCLDIGNLRAGDLIRYTYSGSIDGAHVAQGELVFSYDVAPITQYTDTYGSLRHMSAGGYNYPATNFRMAYGTPETFDADKLAVRMASVQGNVEVIDFGTVPHFFYCSGQRVKVCNRFDFMQEAGAGSRILLLGKDYGYMALIAYQY